VAKVKNTSAEFKVKVRKEKIAKDEPKLKKFKFVKTNVFMLLDNNAIAVSHRVVGSKSILSKKKKIADKTLTQKIHF
jgi:hypothetical protein